MSDKKRGRGDNKGHTAPKNNKVDYNKEIHRFILTPTESEYEAMRKRNGYTQKHYGNIRAVEKIFSLMSNRDKRWLRDDPKVVRFYDPRKTDFKNRYYGDVVYMHNLDKPAGFIDVWRRSGYLDICIGVNKYYKHRGIATRMFKKFIQQIRTLKKDGKFDRTYKEIRWCCHIDNVKSYNCALKLGFVDKGLFTKYNGKSMPFDEVVKRIQEVAIHDLKFDTNEDRDAFIKDRTEGLVTYNYLSYKL